MTAVQGDLIWEKHMTTTLDALDHPPNVCGMDGDIVISGPYANVAYTIGATRLLIERLEVAITEAEGGSA